MTFRRRMNRRADSGIPGYDNLGRLNMGHPASKELPEVDQYGFDSEFGEGVRKGPYLSGPPPASVGWMPEHPATKKSLVEDYEIGHELHDANIKKAMERKANKCIAIAEHRLGRTASAREIESLALRLMDLPNNSINSKFASATDFMAEDEVMGMDEMGMDEMGFDEYAGHSHASFMAEDEEADDELSELMAELEAGEDQADDEGLAELMAEIEAEDAISKKASYRRNRQASLRGRRASMYASHQMADEDDELATLMADLEAGDELQNATGYHGSDIGPGNRNAEFDGGIMGFDGMMMEDDFSDAMSPVDVLAEEITNLKQANARLKHRLRQAEEAVQDATGYHGEEDSVQPAGRYKEPGEGQPTARYASKNGLKRLANVLADYLAEEEGHMGSHGHMSSFMAEDDQADEESVMAEILAEIEGAYDPNISQNNSQFGYQENLLADDEEADDEDVASMLASMLAEEQAKKQAAAKKAPAKAEKASAKKESEDPMGLDEEADEESSVDPKLASLFAKFAEDDEADEEEADEEETTASKKKASAKGKMSTKSEKKSTKGKLAEDDEADEEEETASKKSSKGEKKSNKKAFEWKFSADEEADEEEADEEEADDEEEETSKKASWRFAEEEEADEEEADEEETTSSKKASFSPRPSINSRKASVKTLGNISRTASKSDSNELSKLWESAPDVSKYFS